MFVEDLAEVVDRVTPVTRATIGKPEATGWVAGIAGAGPSSGRNSYSSKADGIQSEKDIAAAGRAQRSDVELRRISLVEHIEESGSELNLLRLSNAEVLEERNIEVASTRSSNIKRWLRWASIRERGDRQLREIVSFMSQCSATYLRISKIDRRDRTQTSAGVSTIERVRPIPSQGLTCGRYVASESQTNRYSALDRCDS